MSQVPKLRRHRRRSRADQAFVEIDGERVYLGRWGSPWAEREYRRLIVEWEQTGRNPHSLRAMTVGDVARAYRRHADGYYVRPDGSPTQEAHAVLRTLLDLEDAYGTVPAEEFGPRRLRAFREMLIDRELARSTINQAIARVRRAFRWAGSHEMINPAHADGLRCVEGLRRGRSKAKETRPVHPPPPGAVEATKPHLSRQVRALVELQELTGARSGELVGLRACDLETSGALWTHSPENHKTDYRGKRRVIVFGPEAQKVLRPFMAERPTSAPLFSPAEADRERRERLHARRKTPMSCGNRPGSNRKRSPQRSPGESYTPESYARAVSRAAKAAGVERWHPHQLRHLCATRLRKRFGIEAARAVLGHSTLVVTEVYAEQDQEIAAQAMARIG
jgi:integrase